MKKVFRNENTLAYRLFVLLQDMKKHDIDFLTKFFKVSEQALRSTISRLRKKALIYDNGDMLVLNRNSQVWLQRCKHTQFREVEASKNGKVLHARTTMRNACFELVTAVRDGLVSPTDAHKVISEMHTLIAEGERAAMQVLWGGDNVK